VENLVNRLFHNLDFQRDWLFLAVEEVLKKEVKLLLRDNRKSYMPRSSVCSSVCPSGTLVHCDDAVHVYRWIVKCSGHPNIKARPPVPSRLFPLPGRGVGMDVQTKRDI